MLGLRVVAVGVDFRKEHMRCFPYRGRKQSSMDLGHLRTSTWKAQVFAWGWRKNKDEWAVVQLCKVDWQIVDAAPKRNVVIPSDSSSADDVFVTYKSSFTVHYTRLY